MDYHHISRLPNDLCRRGHRFKLKDDPDPSWDEFGLRTWFLVRICDSCDKIQTADATDLDTDGIPRVLWASLDVEWNG